MAPGARAAETRGRILDAAVPLFAERGLRGVSIAEVARVVGVSPATVFAYFESKEALLADAVGHDAEGLAHDTLLAMGGAHATVHSGWRALWEGLLAGLEKHPLTARMLRHPEASAIEKIFDAPSVRAGLEFYSHELATAQEWGVLRPDIDPAVAGEGLSTLLLAMFVSHLQLGAGLTASRIDAMFAVLEASLHPGTAREGVDFTPVPDPAVQIAPLAPQPAPTTKGERTRERLLDSAIRLFSAGGFQGTSVAQIARDVGITPAAAFAHFPSKELLLDAAFDRDALAFVLRVTEDLAEIDVVDRWPAIVDLLWTVVGDYRLVDHVISGTESESAARMIDTPAIRLGIAALADRIRDAQDRGAARDDVDAAVMAEGLVDIAITMLVARAQSGIAVTDSTRRAALDVLGLVLRPVA